MTGTLLVREGEMKGLDREGMKENRSFSYFPFSLQLCDDVSICCHESHGENCSSDVHSD